MNVYDWFFESQDEAQRAVETLRSLFYKKLTDEDWKVVAGCYDNTISELKENSPTNSYQNARMQIEAEIDNGEVFYEVFGTREKSNFGIDFMPWANILGMTADDLLKSTLPKHEVMAHFLYELTFDGFSEKEMENSRDEIFSRTEDVVEF